MSAYCFPTGVVRNEKVQEYDFRHMVQLEMVLEMFRCPFVGYFGSTEVADFRNIPCDLAYSHFLILQLAGDLAGEWVVNTPRQETLRVHESRQHLQRILELSYHDLQPWLLQGHHDACRCGPSIPWTV